jgi:prepilin-type N-terminal cleavage/methylation domain-containing protein
MRTPGASWPRAVRVTRSTAVAHEPNCDERGFTLVELMVVVMILGILMTIAMVTFARTREPAIDRSAQALLTNGVQAVHVVYSDTRSFSDITRTDLADAEPAIKWRDETTAVEAARHEVSTAIGAVAGVDYVVLSTHTKNGDCLAVREANDSPTLYQRVAGDLCPANAFDPSFGWVAQWPPR